MIFQRITYRDPELPLVWKLLAQPKKRTARLRERAKELQRIDRLESRVRIAETIDTFKTADGFVYVESFSRDCDNCESTWVDKIPAHVTAIKYHEKRLFDTAEGLTYFNMITEREAKNFEPTFRDRNAEYYNY